jgi:hypothetical protein
MTGTSFAETFNRNTEGRAETERYRSTCRSYRALMSTCNKRKCSAN